MGDPRRAFVLETLTTSLAAPSDRDHVRSALDKDPQGALADFLDSASAMTLQATLLSGGSVKLSNKVSHSSTDGVSIMMTKTKPGALNERDLPNGVVVSTISQSPMSSVYSPLLQGKLDGVKDPRKLQGLIRELEAGLGSMLRQGGGALMADPSSVTDPQDPHLLAIMSPSDEFKLWAELSESASAASTLQIRAKRVYKCFEPLRAAFDDLKAQSQEAVLDLVDNTHDALEKVWEVEAQDTPDGYAYRQGRMEHFLMITSEALLGFLDSQFQGVNVWTGSFQAVDSRLRYGLRLIGRWEKVRQDLTGITWLRHRHKWEGKLKDRRMDDTRLRIDEVLRMKEVYQELSKLLTPEEAHSLRLSEVFTPFYQMSPLYTSEFTQPLWMASKDDFEQRMVPIEKCISLKLRELFGSTLIPSLSATVGSKHSDRGGGTLAEAHQVLYELQRYRELMGRPVIAESLANERGNLHKQMMKHLENLRTDFENRADARLRGNGFPNGGEDEHSATSGRNLPRVLDDLTWSIQCEEKLAQTVATFDAVQGLQAVAGGLAEQFDLLSKDLHRDIESFKKDQFSAWQERLNERLQDFKLDKKSKLMDLDTQSGHVKLHYNSELVQLLREVRQLVALGLNIRRDVVEEVDVARQFYRHGMVLKQVSNFYNNIAHQMIPCQKMMMLEDAKQFEHLLSNPKDGLGKIITWGNPVALEGYIMRLQGVANGLTDKNRRLRKWHRVIGEKVCEMMNLDLVRQRERWGKGVKDMREIFQKLEREGFTAESQSTWRQHWDHQIYKVLECQYARGLECLNETLPQMEVKLVFKQKRLQFEPPLEEIRTQHYKNIKMFLNLPLTHKGVSDLSAKPGFFRHMVDKNAKQVAKVYEHAEVLFARLGEEQKKVADWVTLGTVDLDEFCDANLEEVGDWDQNDKMVKQARKDLERMPVEAKIDCYQVNMQPLKSAVEGHLNSLRDALINSLSRSAKADKEEVEAFIAEGKTEFEKEASSVEEIGAQRNWAKVQITKMTKIMQKRRRVDEKNKLLKTMAGTNAQQQQQAVVDMSAANNDWDNFTQKLQKHDSHLEAQTAQLVSKNEKKIAEFQAKVDSFAARWHELKPKGAPQGDPQLMLNKIEDDHRAFQEMQEEAEKMRVECEQMGMEPPNFSSLKEAGEDIESTRQSWSRYGQFSEERRAMGEKDWISFRKNHYQLEDMLTKWGDAVKSQGNKDAVAILLLQEIEKYRKCLPYLKFVRGDGWERNHWIQLFNMLGMPTKGPNALSVETLTVDHFLDKADMLVKHADQIKHLHAQAQGEVTLREALRTLQVWGLERQFVTMQQDAASASGKAPVSLLKEWKELMTEVGDHQALVGSLKESPFFAPFKEETGVWETRLANLSECCMHLNAVQRKWVYLEPIFARGALPHEQPRFKRVDDEFRSVMKSIQNDPSVVSFADIPRLRDTLPQMSAQLDICQRALSDFLEDKRSYFPRFYFIGDDDLLEILGQAKNPEVIQTHLKKLFAGIHKVVFGEGCRTITGMQSMAGEQVPLNDPVPVDENVEVWLGLLAAAMTQTLSSNLSACVALKDYQKYPSQILSIADMVHFTQKAESAIQQGKLATFRDSLLKQLEEYTSYDAEGHKVMQLKLQSLVLDLIHNIDIVDQLVAEGAGALSDWAWHRQMRYYSKGSACNVVMAESKMDYSFEYQGNAPKLVYTPLTDKCYLTLTQGMALGYGGNPYGPAGTGKTESVKALGQCLGRQVLVFNCDEEFDFKSMGRIFNGLVKCGAWGCFDEFNRLEEEVLSAVSQQIQTIQAALKTRVQTMEFMGKQVNVDHRAGIFVTLNPAGKGYGGRSKLPDNLKQLFRSVAMTVPDNPLIAEVLLLSEGFKNARELGRKLVSLFGLCKQLLSPQQHYDWGLRALKTVLGIAGKQLGADRAAKVNINKSQEIDYIIRSMRVSTLPKLTFDDSERFGVLLTDVFPGVPVSDVTDEELSSVMASVLSELGLEGVKAQTDKMLQMHLACAQRIGVIVVGPSGSGKTTLWRVLEAAYKKLGRPVKIHVMNPKAVPRQQLLGHMDMDTREWFDGILTAAARQVVKEPLEQHSWIICDGDIDPEWIESLNSVLDDNRLLTLPSGERIQFGPNVNFIFECHDLKFASPATVSRAGMIFLSDENINVEVMLKAWLSRQPEDLRARLEGWMGDYFARAFDLALQKPNVVETTKAGILYNGLSHIVHVDSKRDFCCKLARGFGANMDEDTRSELHGELARLFGESDLEQLPAPLSGEASESGLVLVDTVNQTLATIQPWVESGEPFILVGPEGCGKATLLQHAFAQQKSTSVAVINCSAQTTALHAMQKLTQVCGQPVSTNDGRVLRPRDSDRLVIYFKDLNLPKPDKYATIQLISFLQQLVTFRGYYDENLEFIGLEPGKIQIVGSMNPSTTVGRSLLTTRFTAIVRVAFQGYPERAQLQTVYYNKLKATLSAHPTYGPDAQLRKLASSMIEIYDAMTQTFSADDHRHYKLTPRHLTEWVRGLERYDLMSGSIDLMDAFAYEAARVFRDRLVGVDAEHRFDSLLSSAIRSQWRANLDPEALFTTWAVPTEGDRVDDSPELGAMTPDDFHELVSAKLIAYEREVKDLHVLLFPEVLQRLAQYDRVLSQAGGSMLLVGRSGVGRRSTLTLAAYMHRMELVTPSMARGYGIKAFRTDLKGLLVRCGVEGERLILHVEDFQLVDPAMLEILNSVLSSGEVPGLFTNEELDGLMAPLREQMASEGFQHKTLFAYFSAQVQRNLRVVISMDPGNSDFAMRCESNPALFNRCSIQWLQGWSQEGLEQVPGMLLKEVMDASEDDYDEDLIQHMVSIQSMVNATPRQYVTFVEMYRKIFTAKRGQLLEQRSFLNSGLAKLAEAESKVDELSRQAGKQRTLLSEKQAQAEQSLQQITVAMTKASASKEEVRGLQEKLAVEEGELNSRKGGVEAELAEVEPLIAQAKQAVGSIKSDNINEIRSLKMPPDAIRDVLEGVLRILGNPDTSWNNMKKFLGMRSVKDDLINFDARKVTPNIRHAVNQLLAQKGQSFEHQVIYRVSVAAAPLAAWVKAIVKYSIVLERIAPLEAELGTLQESLDQSVVRLRQCEEDLQMLDDQVSALKEDFSARTREVETLKMSLKSATDQLEAAESLLGKLGGEKGRWQDQVQALGQELLELPLNGLMSAGFITYLAAAMEDRRTSVVQNWCKTVQVRSEFSFTGFMSSESEMLKWKGEGLPSDSLSMQNAIILLQSIQVPYIIDPSTQATGWLKGHIKSVGATLETINLQDARFQTTFELAVRFGKTLVVEEVDGIEPILYTVLRGDLLRQGTRLLVQIGEKTVDYNENFRLYLSTRNPYPVIPPDAVSLVGLTNFSITHSGLESQLLGITIQHEKPELEQQKSAILQEEEQLKMQLAELEKSLLQTLAKSEGNILENTALINALSETKTKSNTIQEGLAKSAELQADLDQQRNVYQPIAHRGALMFFLMRDLRSLDHMYQFSLNLFLKLFNQALDTDTPGGDTAVRITVLTSTLLQMVFAYTSRSLFKADRLTFGMHFARHLQPALFDAASWDYFLGVLVDAGHAGRAHPKPDWVPEPLAGAFANLITAIPSLMGTFDLSNNDVWRQWMASPVCETQFPEGRHNPFQELLITQAFRPDRLELSMSRFICRVLEIKSVSPPSMSIQKIYEVESTAREPILFITTPGADPSQELEDFAERTIGKGRYHQVAMGQGQAEVAMGLLRQCAKTGDWLCLKNVHLVVSWLPTLEKEVYTLTPHQDFRIFLTAEPHAKFSASLLQGSLKMTFEAPPGTKKNLQRTYEAWTQDYIGSGAPVRAQVLFLLAWFHAIVQERRNFVPNGWSKFYEFSSADLRSGADIIDLTTSGGRAPQWKYITGLLENAIYGGRVDNVYDIKVLRTYLHLFFNQEMVSTSTGSRAKALPGTRSIMLPTSSHLPDYLGLISQLPDADEPSIFHMPLNSNRTVQEANSTRVLVQLKTMATSKEAVAGFDREVWAKQLAPVLKLWERLVQQFPQIKAPLNPRDVNMQQFKTPTDVFVAMEYLHGRTLLLLMEKGVGSIARVLRGQEMLTPAVQEQAAALLCNEVPSKWDAKWEGPEDPLQYIRAATSRLVQVEKLFAVALKGGIMSMGAAINLSHLYHPDTFLNALRQQTARALNESMDSLQLVTTWDMGYNPGHQMAAAVTGLQIQGAAFNGRRLEQVSSEAPSTAIVPDAQFMWALKTQPVPYPNALATPLYSSNDRSKVLFEVQLPLVPGEDQNGWILAGVALFVAT